jgi:hypothetical protein
VTSLTRTVATTPLPARPVLVARPRLLAISGPEGPRQPSRRAPSPEVRQGGASTPAAARQTPAAERKSGSGDDGGSRGSDARNPGFSRMWRMFVL